MIRKKRSLPAPLHLSLPATSANLGPAFDAAALAMDLYITVDARVASDFKISASGRDKAVCQEVQNHLILKTYREVLQRAGAEVIPLYFRIANQIPIGKGCGSSAAARLAGIALANHFGQLRWSDDQIIAEGSRREKHSDNVAACWLGGLTVARMSEDGQAHVACVRPKGNWPLMLAIPGEVLPTEEARRVLPDHYSRTDAVLNIQNSMLLLAAFSQGQHDLLAAALEDRIHQPYRSVLCPLLPALQPLTGKQGVLGVAISGAGPSILIFLDPKVPVQKTKRLIDRQISSRGLKSELIATSISLRGARTSLR
jgi:homoserine kinase